MPNSMLSMNVASPLSRMLMAYSQAAHKIVVTHHVPSFRMLHPKFQGSKANVAFTVELEDYITDSGIDYWIYGHSHTNIDARIGNTQCLSNQLGYVFLTNIRTSPMAST